MRQQPINVRCENAAGRPGQIREFILAVSQGTTLVAPSKFNDIFLTIYQTFTLLVPYCLFSDTAQCKSLYGCALATLSLPVVWYLVAIHCARLNTLNWI